MQLQIACRTIGGSRGGRSTYGVCLGALSWRIEDGRAGELDLSQLNVVIASRYEDDVPGSPWDFYLYLDERGDERQRGALEQIFLGHLGGTPLKQFPWAYKDSNPLGVPGADRDRPPGEMVPGRRRCRCGSAPVMTRKRLPARSRATISRARVHAETRSPPLEFDLTDRCGYESKFAASSDGRRPRAPSPSSIRGSSVSVSAIDELDRGWRRRKITDEDLDLARELVGGAALGGLRTP